MYEALNRKRCVRPDGPFEHVRLRLPPVTTKAHLAKRSNSDTRRIASTGHGLTSSTRRAPPPAIALDPSIVAMFRDLPSGTYVVAKYANVGKCSIEYWHTREVVNLGWRPLIVRTGLQQRPSGVTLRRMHCVIGGSDKQYNLHNIKAMQVTDPDLVARRRFFEVRPRRDFFEVRRRRFFEVRPRRFFEVRPRRIFEVRPMSFFGASTSYMPPHPSQRGGSNLGISILLPGIEGQLRSLPEFVSRRNISHSARKIPSQHSPGGEGSIFDGRKSDWKVEFLRRLNEVREIHSSDLSNVSQ